MSNNTVIKQVFRDYADAPRWVNWRVTDGRKVPFVAGTSRKADASNPATWRTLEQCNDQPAADTTHKHESQTR